MPKIQKYLVVITVEGGDRHSRVMDRELYEKFLGRLMDQQHLVQVLGELVYADKKYGRDNGEHDLYLTSCNIVSVRAFEKSGDDLKEILEGIPVKGSIETPAVDVDNEGTEDHPDITDPNDNSSAAFLDEPAVVSSNPNDTDTTKQSEIPF